ncbi:MAG: thiamine phosphate synthase [Hydrocarboniphaga sp.]|uniref:thiamine phosphate synthase n=1 Tax=Hydrocarboniphaga sp. TaxID=2033016 RepID=UPI00262AABA8|nr:thiamine phosphate synthase [Hydrocarboniphaga sp.]MDB5969283.1 thiamine phosphate synthase [Hydrocarboniphaga sp.]
MNNALSGLYAITSQALCETPQRLQAGVAAAIAGGARVIQYRDKQNDAPTRLDYAKRLRRLCRDAGALFIVNDDMQMAAIVDADGLHLGKTDGAIAAARALLGDSVLIGVSCSGDLQRALAARQQGADYVAFGRFYDSNTKPDAPLAGLDALREARAQLRLPICAIGGITPDNAAPLLAAGADMIAAVDGVFGAADIEAAARRYASLFP